MLSFGSVASSQSKVVAVLGTISTFTYVNDGAGNGVGPLNAVYSATGGSGTGASFRINYAALDPFPFSACTLNNGGLNYQVGNTLTVVDGNGGTTTITVTAVV